MNEQHLERYAWLVVKFGVDLRPGDDLYIRGERIHRELAFRIGEAAYDLGARRVHYRFADPLEVSQLIRRGSLEDVARYHQRNQAWYAEVERSRSPVVFLDGQELPQSMSSLARTKPDKHAAFTRASSEAFLTFFRNAVDRRLCPMAVAAGATPAWARRLCPELPESAATSRLWELICRFTYADQDDALERLTAHDRAIRRRMRALDELGIREGASPRPGGRARG